MSRAWGATVSGVFLAGLVLLGGCGGRSEAGGLPTPAAPGNAVPLPRDLDVVAWLDVSQLSSIVAGSLPSVLVGLLAEFHAVAGDSLSARLNEEVLSRATRVWLGCRPSVRGCEDLVLVGGGDYGSFRPEQTAADLVGPLDVGGGWHRYDRPVRARTDVARVYLAPPGRVVLVAHAEVDAVERLVERGGEATDLVVAERGLLTVGLRPLPVAEVLRGHSAAGAQLLSQARHVEFSGEVRAGAAWLRGVVGFQTEEQARRASRAVELVLLGIAEQVPGAPTTGIRVRAEGADVRLEIPFARTTIDQQFGQAGTPEPH